jgi:hypothetical protein
MGGSVMATGDHLCSFSCLAAELPNTGFPTFGLRNDHAILSFDATADNTAYFSGVLPDHYDGGGLDVEIHWCAATATGNTCVWAIDIDRIGEGQQNIGGNSWAGAQTASATAPGTAGLVDIHTDSFTTGSQMDGLLKNEMFFLSIMRDVDPTDNMSGDAQLLQVVIRET